MRCWQNWRLKSEKRREADGTRRLIRYNGRLTKRRRGIKDWGTQKQAKIGRYTPIICTGICRVLCWKEIWTKIIKYGASQKMYWIVFLHREIFVDATRAMSVVSGEKDNKQVGLKGFKSSKSVRLWRRGSRSWRRRVRRARRRRSGRAGRYR